MPYLQTISLAATGGPRTSGLFVLHGDLLAGSNEKSHVRGPLVRRRLQHVSHADLDGFNKFLAGLLQRHVQLKIQCILASLHCDVYWATSMKQNDLSKLQAETQRNVLQQAILRSAT